MNIFRVIKKQRELANNPGLLDTSLLKANAFTRRRVGGMNFPETLSFMLDMRKTTIQTRLNQFYRHVKGGDPISQPAFTKLRAQFNHKPFEAMVREIVEEEYSGQYELPTWHGFHLLADDGSYLQLPMTPELAEEYGVRGGRPSAGISVLYDVLHGWVLDPIITHTDMNEREQMKNHIAYLREQLPYIANNALLLLDRGYPSQEILTWLEDQGLRFCIRCQNNFTIEAREAPLGSSDITFKSGQTLRVVKLPLPGGEVETLITNLFDLPQEDYQELYARRWGIETLYFRLKQIVGVEKFSGKTPNSIRQDFWASMVLINNAAVLQKEADDAVAEHQKTKNNKHFYRARSSDLIVIMRDRFIFATLCRKPEFTRIEFNAIMRELARAVSPVRPGRHFPHIPKPHAAAKHNLKSSL